MSGFSADILPLDLEQKLNITNAVRGLSPEQLQWISGYTAGLAAAGETAMKVANADSAALISSKVHQEKLTVLYGSQTGNGEDIANSLVKDAVAKGFTAQAFNLSDYKPANLKRESLVTFVISTHGEGDPPDDAELFYEFLLSKKAPKLENLKYSVLALGDSSYVNFCQTGREFDSRLNELGANRFEAFIECDLIYEELAAGWRERIVDGLSELLDAEQVSAVPILHAVESTSVFGKSNPFAAEVLVNQKITGNGSSKDVRHIELSLEGSGLTYDPGDSLAVIADNPPQLVTELLTELKFQADTTVIIKDAQLNLKNLLSSSLEITTLNLGFLRAWAEASTDAGELHSLLEKENAVALTDFIDQHQIIDVIRQYPATVGEQQFAEMLRPLSPRSYSIASSLEANPDEVHLTVAAVRYGAFGRDHWGAASTHLADRVKEGEKVSVYVEKNRRFRLPADDVPIVMIGPGTGIAPFRAFVEERVERDASGDNWLFFGDRNFGSDFLYQLEWHRYLKQGNLERLDVAFSRDQHKKIYVQDRIFERGAELYRWIERGAAIYVCGDAKHMASDVHHALIEVFKTYGDLDYQSAEQKLKELRAVGRYQRDVY
ncbi:MAG: assimilatory sulfite reductase (NADPH) flavoprotein subunit [Woeseiaceae bacterium]|nr:assimilatory sulfite reductase (NADPH) flavoprotein subunit [Woeseiaceae bacterium]